MGERQHVLVTEESFDAQYYVAHNKFYEQVRTLLSLMSIDLLYIGESLKRLYLTLPSSLTLAEKALDLQLMSLWTMHA